MLQNCLGTATRTTYACLRHDKMNPREDLDDSRLTHKTLSLWKPSDLPIPYDDMENDENSSDFYIADSPNEDFVRKRLNCYIIHGLLHLLLQYYYIYLYHTLSKI